MGALKQLPYERNAPTPIEVSLSTPKLLFTPIKKSTPLKTIGGFEQSRNKILLINNNKSNRETYDGGGGVRDLHLSN